MRRLILSMIIAASAILGADVSGTWNATIEIQGNTGNPTFVLKQDGDKLTGTYSGLLGEAPITGTVKGDQVMFQFDVKSDHVAGTVKYRGTVNGSKMSGTAALGDLGEGTWTATKK